MKRYTSEREKAALNLAAALDPRFEALKLLSDNEKQETFARITDEAAALMEHQVN